MRTISTLALGGMLTLGVTGIVMDQDNGAPPKVPYIYETARHFSTLAPSISRDA